MDPFLGQVIMFAGNFAPRGWAFCEGQLLAISANTALFSILGTTYGGDGRTTFGLPDLRGRVPVSPGAGPGLPSITQGQRFGNPTTTLTVSNLPAASIHIPCSSDDATSDEPTGLAPALTSTSAYATPSPGEQMAAGSIQGATNQAFSNSPPALGIYFIIATQGTYPSRS